MVSFKKRDCLWGDSKRIEIYVLVQSKGLGRRGNLLLELKLEMFVGASIHSKIVTDIK